MGCVDAYDSHSTDWFPDLMSSTKGTGVNIILNSLAGEHVNLFLEALSPRSCHCKIEKVDIFVNRRIKLAVFRKYISYNAIDVDRIMEDDPKLIRELIAACMELIEEKKVLPLPCTVYSYKDYHDALRCMMNGQHRGKFVLTPPGPSEKLTVVDGRPIFGTGEDGSPRTVVMSGCLGGFGIHVLLYVITLGTTNILLLDRDHERKRLVDWDSTVRGYLISWEIFRSYALRLCMLMLEAMTMLSSWWLRWKA
jgi:hypothetical protein